MMGREEAQWRLVMGGTGALDLLTRSVSCVHARREGALRAVTGDDGR
jgi:hypothetical protein